MFRIITLDNIAGLNDKKCVRPARRWVGPFLLHWSSSDFYAVFVLGWDSAVVEGRSSYSLVGSIVVFFDKIVDFGELILSAIALPSDLERAIRQLRFRVEAPLEHSSLTFSGSAAMRVGDAFEPGVDAAFQTVRC